MQRHVYEAPFFTGHMSRAAAQLLREAKTRIRDGRTMEHRPVSPKVMQFVRQFFPENQREHGAAQSAGNHELHERTAKRSRCR